MKKNLIVIQRYFRIGTVLLHIKSVSEVTHIWSSGNLYQVVPHVHIQPQYEPSGLITIM